MLCSNQQRLIVVNIPQTNPTLICVCHYETSVGSFTIGREGDTVHQKSSFQFKRIKFGVNFEQDQQGQQQG